MKTDMKFYRMGSMGDAGGFWYLSLPKATALTGGKEKLDGISTGEITTKSISLTLHGRKKADILYGEKAFFINKKAIDAFTSSGLTGWDTFPIRLIVSRPFSEKFYGLVFKGKAKNLSTVDPLKGPQLAFEFKSWDGSDFFSSGFNGGMKILTEKAVDVILAAKLVGPVFDEVTPK